MTISEAAKYLKLSRRTIYRLIDREILPAEKMGDFLWVIPTEQVKAYAQAMAGKSKHDPTRYAGESD